MRRAILILSYIYFLTFSPTTAQERLPAEELLRFFPLDDYEQIDHSETAMLRASKNFEVYEQFSSSSWTRKNEPMPEELIDAAESFTHARKVRVYTFLWKPGETKFGQRGRGARGSMADIGDTTYAAEGVGEELYVLRYLDLPAVLKKYSDAGVIADTGETLGGMAIYSAQKKGLRGADYTVQMVALETGELLVAENRATLKRMVATARGEETSILGDPTYLTFEDALEYSGQNYRWGTHQHMQNAIYKYAEKRGQDPSEIEAAKEKAEAWQFLFDINVWDISGPVVARQIWIYASEDIARERLSRKTGPIPAGMKLDDYNIAIRAVQEHSVDGEKQITTITYDADTVKKLTEAKKLSREKWEEEQKRKEEAKEKADDGK